MKQIACAILSAGLMFALPSMAAKPVGRTPPGKVKPAATPVYEAASQPEVEIPDLSSESDTLQVVPDGGVPIRIKKVIVSVNVLHPYIGDLTVVLKHAGAIVTLFSRHGGWMQNFNLTFDDAALSSIVELPYAMPVEGTYRPYSPLAVFSSTSTKVVPAECDARGDWTLEVADGSIGYQGVLAAWSIQVETY